ncbi:MAG: hypothetical protein SFX74_03580 [Fimbriimonadaceae bacterium]|nr:hypothetical protein [Fimbriimonadaceae bacterium]
MDWKTFSVLSVLVALEGCSTGTKHGILPEPPDAVSNIQDYKSRPFLDRREIAAAAARREHRYPQQLLIEFFDSEDHPMNRFMAANAWLNNYKQGDLAEVARSKGCLGVQRLVTSGVWYSLRNLSNEDEQLRHKCADQNLRRP